MTVSLPAAQKPAPGATRPRRRFPTLRCIGALMLREMATTYGRSPGGYIWAILEPVAGIFILTAASSFMMARPPIGTSFELFYATGMLPFFMFNMICSRVGTAIIFSKPLLAYPAVTYVDALIARFIVNFLTELLVFFIVMTILMLNFDTRAVLDYGMIAKGLAMVALFSFSLGTLNAWLFMRFHVWHVLWSVISRPLFLISGVFFMYEYIPEPLKTWLWFNPVLHCIGMVRAGFYPSYNDSYVSTAYVLLLSLSMLALALLILSRQVKTLLYEG
ncbi:ABC transporter permease [Pseudogemmobacter humi]|uniref:Transport permease protein n=1 Tax=Pseudogemmobacter humi TaxID=2483812 RepID=A0A3P5XN60_9RHOB|nr:ABC transporter permease [Pseudogemmobacter humi]VDC33186.1 Polysialic acid transport protein KpsM [Pseudogemmobacter humi]